MLVLNLLACENKKNTKLMTIPWNGPYGEIPTKKEPIRNAQISLKTTLSYNNRSSLTYKLCLVGFCLINYMYQLSIF